MKRIRIVAGLACLFAFDVSLTFSKDAKALAVLSQIAQGVGVIPVVSQVSLEGTANYTAGSDSETFPIDFTASGFDDTSMLLKRSGGVASEIRHKGIGTWFGVDGVSHAYAVHNTWTTAAWFAPTLLLSAWLSDPELVISDLGQEQRDGIAVEHVQCFRQFADMPALDAGQVAAVSRMNLYLDTKAGLPVGLEFSIHPDNDAGTNIPVRVEYSQFKTSSGIQMPSRVQEYLQNTPLLDITFTSKTVGVIAADQAVQ